VARKRIKKTAALFTAVQPSAVRSAARKERKKQPTLANSARYGIICFVKQRRKEGRRRYGFRMKVGHTRYVIESVAIDKGRLPN
jgi:hypothetical protein